MTARLGPGPDSAPLDASAGASTPTDERDFRLAFLLDLADQRARIAGDVIEIGRGTWAIHGTIPVDGDVLMASFDEPSEAEAFLAQLSLSSRMGAR